MDQKESNSLSPGNPGPLLTQHVNPES
jgi:hypothetical protein